MLEVILQQITDFYKKYDKEKFNIMIREDISDFKICGFNFVYLLGRVIVNREGMSEYKKLLNGYIK